MRGRCWLLVDLDGVLNVDASNSDGRRRGLRRLRMTSAASGRAYTMHLLPDACPRLQAVSGSLTLAWATTWGGQANDYRLRAAIGGLPVLPVADPGQWSKVPGILALVGSDPFVWLDDFNGDDDQAAAETAAAAAAAGRHLVVRVDPAVGLFDEHLAAAQRFAAGVEGGPGQGR